MFKVKKQLCNAAKIECSSDLASTFQDKDGALIILNEPNRKYSVATGIEEISVTQDDEPTITISSKIADLITDDDSVKVIPIKIPDAEKIIIGLDEKAKFFDGDWTPSIIDSLRNKIIDLGNEITFLVPYNSGTMIKTGKIIFCSPKPPPLKITNRTRIHLKKLKNEEFDKKNDEILKEKEERAKNLLEEIKLNAFEAVASLKGENSVYAGDKIVFEESNPSVLFRAIEQIFQVGYFRVEESREYNSEEDYTATCCFAFQEQQSVKYLVEIQVSSSGSTGVIVTNLYAKEKNQARKYLDRLSDQIMALKFSLKQRAESMEAECPKCGDPLPLEDADAEGTVRCRSCHTLLKLPKRLRN